MFQQKDYMPKHEYPQCGGCTGGAIKEPTNTAGIKSNDPWDNLKVGDILVQDKAECTVLGIVDELVFTSIGKLEEWGKSFFTKHWFKVNGWTIKDSTPKEEEALEVGSLYLNGKTHLWRLLLDGTFQFFDDSNKKWSKGINVLKDV